MWHNWAVERSFTSVPRTGHFSYVTNSGDLEHEGGMRENGQLADSTLPKNCRLSASSCIAGGVCFIFGGCGVPFAEDVSGSVYCKIAEGDCEWQLLPVKGLPSIRQIWR